MTGEAQATGEDVRFVLTGVARLRAGEAEVSLAAASLGEALARLARRLPGVVPDVVGADGTLTRHFIASRNGAGFTRDGATPLRSGDVVTIVGAQAGG